MQIHSLEIVTIGIVYDLSTKYYIKSTNRTIRTINYGFLKAVKYREIAWLPYNTVKGNDECIQMFSRF